ncbi:MAG: hypothetical protein A3A12_00005 [Candidatus Staskawiczbacteria bacterium RIFCSPLOWO2_01_FULL_43_17b]|nr:MAG: hypothetical protein A3A12_00005 [Candidatus Staskawiczbacteria bacterium RIFCSPLOWO2_01_FULL_43_17b]
MLSRATVQLVEEVFSSFDEPNATRNRMKAKENPEALVVSLLLVLKKELPEVSAMLSDVEMALYEDNLKEARERIKQAEKSS